MNLKYAAPATEALGEAALATKRQTILSALNKRRTDIVAALRGSRRSSPLLLTDDAIIRDIAGSATFGGALAPLYPNGLTAKLRRTHFHRLAATLDRSREALDQTLNHADTDPEFLMELMIENIKAHLLSDEPDFAEPIQRARDAIAELASLAAAAAARVPVQRGTPGGNHVINPDLYRSLASVYADATGRKAGSGDGPFLRFAATVVEALAISTPKNYNMKEAARDALSDGQITKRRSERRRRALH